ncbi:MAG: hypothetical protein HAW60_06180 [Bdellovibrionales bacterium]|nr:hypothetical protein [Bdellovibrionales bacterium]
MSFSAILSAITGTVKVVNLIMPFVDKISKKKRAEKIANVRRANRDVL